MGPHGRAGYARGERTMDIIILGIVFAALIAPFFIGLLDG